MATVGELLTCGHGAACAPSGSESARLDAELLLGWAIGAERTAVIAHPEAPGRRRRRGRVRRRRSCGARPASRWPTSAASRSSTAWPSAWIARALIPRPGDRAAGRRGRARSGLAADVRAAAGRDAEAAGRRRGHGLGRDRDRAGDAAAASGGCCPRSRSWRSTARPRRSTWPARTRSATPSRTRSPSPRRTCCRAAEPPFDLILANLPYIPSGDIDGLPVAASFEPRLALDGGPDGLALVRRLLAGAAGGAAPGRDGAARDRLRPGAGRRGRRRRAAGRVACRDPGRPLGQPAAGPRANAGRPQRLDAADRPRRSAAALDRDARSALPIRLIALDIDGTLVGEDLVIGERTLAAIAEATRRGHRRLAGHGPHGHERGALRRGARPDRAGRGPAGRADPGDAGARLRARRAGCSTTARSGPRSRSRSSAGAGSATSCRTSTIWSG